MMVIFLTGLVSIILMRTLHKDYARLTREVDEFDVSICFLNPSSLHPSSHSSS